MPLNRRTFLRTLGVAAAFAAPFAVPFRLRAAKRAIGLQLYTVRTAMARDVEATLAEVAAVGYRTVEFAGYHGVTPARIRQLLQEHGLTAPSSHVPFTESAGDWERALAAAREAGHEYVTVPWLPESARSTPDAWRRTAEQLNRMAAAARAAGLCFAYHNHDFELTRLGDVVALELLMAGTDPGLVEFQLDVYWAVRAGHDPIDWLRRYPGRVTMLHLKDSSGAPDHRIVDVGAGTIDFPAILAQADVAGVRHSFVEHDRPADAMASIRASHDYLSRMEGS